MPDHQRLGQFIINSSPFNNEENYLYNIPNEELFTLINRYKQYLYALGLCPICETQLKPELTVKFICMKCGWCDSDSI